MAKVITGVFDYISQSACVSSGENQLSNISMVSVFLSHRVDTAIPDPHHIDPCLLWKEREIDGERDKESERER